MLIFLTLYAKTIPFFSYSVYPTPEINVNFSHLFKNVNIIRFFTPNSISNQFFVVFILRITIKLLKCGLICWQPTAVLSNSDRIICGLLETFHLFIKLLVKSEKHWLCHDKSIRGTLHYLENLFVELLKSSPCCSLMLPFPTRITFFKYYFLAT